MQSNLANSASVNLLHPPRLTFGTGCLGDCMEYLSAIGTETLLLLTVDPCLDANPDILPNLKKAFPNVLVRTEMPPEPSIPDLENLLEDYARENVDTVVGIGGGSVLDMAKLFSVLHGTSLSPVDIIGKDRIRERRIRLVCLPSTSGAGSEVSPNAILYDPETENKQAAVSPMLLPDAAFIDPVLTCSLPPALTAATGIDALCHCIEAYTNKFSHPIVDRYAEEGIRLIASSLERAVKDGQDLEARAAMALGSMYGGLCLGPVNTAAVHALSYPLGSSLRLAHGLSNALLLPAVMEFNLTGNPAKYARIAQLMGVTDGETKSEIAIAGIQSLRELMSRCGLPQGLRSLGLSPDTFPELARAALKVERLLRNNPRPISQEDAEYIYQQAY